MAKRNPPKTTPIVDDEADNLLAELDETPEEQGYKPAEPLVSEDDDADFDALLQESDEVADEDDADLDDLLNMEAQELTDTSPSPAEDPQAMVQERTQDEAIQELLDEDEKGGLRKGQLVEFHTLVDGLEIFGKKRKRGANVSVVVGTLKYFETENRAGFSWLTILDDPQAQTEYFGRIQFAPGKLDDPRRLDIATPEFIDPEDEKAVRTWQDAVLAAADAL